MKRRMSKITVIMLVLVLALSMAACGSNDDSGSDNANEESPLDLYNAASKKMNEVDSYSATADMEMAMSVQGQSIDTSSDVDMKIVNKEENNIEFQTKILTESPLTEQPIEQNQYYRDGFLYTEGQGAKTKTALNMEDAIKSANSASTGEISSDAVKEQSVTDKDGGKEVTLTLDGAKMKDQIGSAAGQLEQYGASVDDITMSDTKLVAVIDSDGNIKSNNMEFSMTTEVQGQEVTMDMKINMIVEQIGGVKVEFPSDLDTYTEV